MVEQLACGTQGAKGCESLLYTPVQGGRELLASYSGNFTSVEKISGA
jgi:hypothetical protein